MKQFLFISALCLLSVMGVRAQETSEYHPFIEKGKVWTVGRYHEGATSPHTLYTYYFKGDTLIYGRSWKKLRCQINGEDGIRDEYVTSIYEEKGKVWYYFVGDRPLYDFNSGKWTNVRVERPSFEKSEYVTITDVATVNILGTARKCVCFVDNSERVNPLAYSCNFWIEGIGSISSPIKNIGLNEPGQYEVLLECRVGDTVIYTEDNNPAGVLNDQDSFLFRPSYHPLAKEGKEWVFKSYHSDYSGGYQFYYSYTVRGDTVINNVPYKKLYMKMQNSNYEFYTAALRDEGSRAYMVPSDEEKEYIYYDIDPTWGEDEYGNEITDSLGLANGLGARPWGHYAFTYTHGLTLRRQGWLIYPITVHTSYDWIEGVGGEEDYFICPMFYPYKIFNLCTASGLGQLISCFEDGVCIYGNENGIPESRLAREVAFSYEAKEGLHHGPSQIVAEAEEQVLNIFFLDAKDKFVIYDADNHEYGEFYSPMYRRLPLYDRYGTPNSYRIESDYEVFTIDITTAQDFVYRPFVKEGKMWRTVVIEQDDEPNRFYDYWLYGCTVVEGQEYWKLGRSELSLDIDPSCPAAVDTTFMGVLYEKDGKVYHAAEENGNFLLLYDFNPSVDDEILLDDGFGHQVSYTVIQKGYNDTECFKGLCIKLQVSVPPALINTWMEGVGNSSGPLKNIHGECATGEEALILCTANDEVLYYDENLVMAIDYPNDPDVKKQQLDFTHVVKPRPKAPAANSQHVEASSEEETVTGEYSIKELFVNFKTLAGPYTVTLTDVNDKEVYRKAIETSNTVGLATDLARYGQGTYTLNIENDEEQYIATLNIDDKTGIEDVNVNGNESLLNHNYYDLSGRRVSVSSMLPRGVYIKDGRKVVIR